MQFGGLLVASSTMKMDARTFLRIVDTYPLNYTRDNPDYDVFYSNVCFLYVLYLRLY
jgi:hypothetical protein